MFLFLQNNESTNQRDFVTKFETTKTELLCFSLIYGISEFCRISGMVILKLFDLHLFIYFNVLNFIFNLDWVPRHVTETISLVISSLTLYLIGHLINKVFEKILKKHKKYDRYFFENKDVQTFFRLIFPKFSFKKGFFKKKYLRGSTFYI